MNNNIGIGTSTPKVLMCENKNCEAGVPVVESEVVVSANYCDYECAIEAEGWYGGIFLRIERERGR